MNYEVLQHSDDLTKYYVQNKTTGRIVVHHTTYKQARDTANGLEFMSLVHLSQQLADERIEWPKELDV